MGIVSLKAEGAYSADKLYKKGMWVTSSGSSYAYINPTPAAGVPLTDTSHWQQIATMGGQDLVDAAVAARDAAIAAKVLAEGYTAQLAAGTASPVNTYANLAALNSANPDHTKIYITLDDGKWCYWGGSAFVAGGVYLAEAKQPLEFTADMWEIGSMKPATGEKDASTTRIRTKSFVRVLKGDVVSVSGGNQMVVYSYSDGYVFQPPATAWSSAPYTVPADGYIMPLVKYSNDATISNVDPLYKSFSVSRFISVLHILDLQSHAQSFVDQSSNNLPTAGDWEIGSMRPATGDKDPAAVNTRIRTKGFIRAYNGDTLSIDDGSLMYVYRYGLDMQYQVSGAEWTTLPYLVDDDCYLRLVLKKPDNSVISNVSPLCESLKIVRRNTDDYIRKIADDGNARLKDNADVNLREYAPINFNLENLAAWESNRFYRCVLIPAIDLGSAVVLTADTYKLAYAFLKDNETVNGKAPNLCSGTIVTTITPGHSKTVDVPPDCAYLYVYISEGTKFGEFSVSRLSVYSDLSKTKEQIRGSAAYIVDAEQMLLTLKHQNSPTNQYFAAGVSSDNLLLIAHISDIHNDATTYGRYISFLNDNAGMVNCGVVTGDVVDSYSSINFDEMNTVEESLAAGIKLIKVVGNHERQTTDTLAQVYAAWNMSTPTGGLYYYEDFAAQGVRVICLNQFDADGLTASAAGVVGHYTQTQIDWLITALQGAITSNYAVVIAYHSCNEVGFPTHNFSGFCQEKTYDVSNTLVSAPIISDIIDAFQRGASLTKTYTFSDSSPSVSVSATFTSNGKFVCFLCGHEHIDYVGYSKVYPKQLICMVQASTINSSTRDEASAHWQSKYDTPRVAGTSTADSINVYGVDVKNRLLKIVKIGSTMTDKFIPRSFSTFPW